MLTSSFSAMEKEECLIEIFLLQAYLLKQKGKKTRWFPCLFLYIYCINTI